MATKNHNNSTIGVFYWGRQMLYREDTTPDRSDNRSQYRGELVSVFSIQYLRIKKKDIYCAEEIPIVTVIVPKRVLADNCAILTVIHCK
jgi:hypothetical protein